MIGAAGGNIKEIRDRFNQVQVTFPDAGKKTDTVTLRGPKSDVDKCYKYLTKVHNDLVSATVKIGFGSKYIICPVFFDFRIERLQKIP